MKSPSSCVSVPCSHGGGPGLRSLLAWSPLVSLFICLCAQAGPTSIALFDHAKQLRESLENQAATGRTQADYERVLNAYRVVYHGDPASSKADDSINAVAELLAEEGRVLHSRKSLRDAIGQYEFLRQQYPYSGYRFAALVAEGAIYRHDLGDRDQAKAKFEEFLRNYPGNPLASQARAELIGIHSEEIAEGTKAHDVTPQAMELPVPGDAIDTAQVARRRPNMPVSDEAGEAGPEGVAGPVAAGTSPDLAPNSRHGRVTGVTGIRHWSTPAYTRIAIDIGDRVPYEAARVPRPDRIYFDLESTRLASGLAGRSVAVTDGGFLKRIRAAQFSDNVTRIVLDVSPLAEYSAFFLPNPWRLIIDIHSRRADVGSGIETAGSPPPTPMPRPRNELERLHASVTDEQSPATGGAAAHTESSSPRDPNQDDSGAYTIREAHPASDGERSLVRTLGLKIGRIVIDPGHGGHDCGTLGPGGSEEKEVVLDVALRLGKLLHQRLGEEVIYTRDDDTFVPLEERTAIANKAHADLFISIHANSSRDRAARGVESYYLNFTTAPDALEVAARENAVSDESIYELSDLVKKITLKDKIEESREFATDVQRSLYGGLAAGNPGLKDRGVKKAPFVVLIGANMPSILAEISFLTNPSDAREMRQAAYRQRIAESLYRGIDRYIHGLSGIRLAENAAQPSGD